MRTFAIAFLPILFCLNLFSTKEACADELYLIVGSPRIPAKHFTHGKVIDAIYEHKSSVLDHENSFNGMATTMDLSQVFLPNLRHIEGDATTFNYSGKIIKSLYVEKFPTMKADDPLAKENYLGEVLQNALAHLEADAELIIEWLPCISFLGDGSQMQVSRSKNPFHGFLDANIFLQTIFTLFEGDEHLKKIPENLSPLVVDFKPVIKNRIESYAISAKQNYDDLLELIYFEALIYSNMLIHDYELIIDYKPFFQDNHALKHARKNLCYIKQPGDICISFGDNISGFKYNYSTFLSGTLINFFAQDISAELQQSFVMNYLKGLPLRDITIERTSNPITGRKNVWLIKATKD